MLAATLKAWRALASLIMLGHQLVVTEKVTFCFPRRTCVAVPLDGVQNSAVILLVAAHDALKTGRPSTVAWSWSLDAFLPYLDVPFVFEDPQKLTIVQPIPLEGITDPHDHTVEHVGATRGGADDFNYLKARGPGCMDRRTSLHYHLDADMLLRDAVLQYMRAVFSSGKRAS
ncbi:hypothetical protein CSAL01_13269 [Colletotrichum salicis]|uniref:Uncharacterized protein n=1 Tax=Colletotrichum salicis TaxID=1209931 RepID=A0A135V7J9_9PEZI|nr:hypothetical protein CSAL01_13269 [Colletotrichum salicis]